MDDEVLIRSSSNPTMTSVTVKQVPLVEPCCLRCSKRIVTYQQTCHRITEIKCDYCADKRIGKRCLDIPVAFHATVNALVAIRNAMVLENRAATADEIQQQNSYTKAVEAHGRNAMKHGSGPLAAHKPESMTDYMALQLLEMKSGNALLEQSVVAQRAANRLLSEANEVTGFLARSILLLVAREHPDDEDVQEAVAEFAARTRRGVVPPSVNLRSSPPPPTDDEME